MQAFSTQVVSTQALSTSAGQTAWLAALLDAFDAVACEARPLDPALLERFERHLNADAQVNAAGSLRYH